MSIESIQPMPDRSPQWENDKIINVKKEGAQAGPVPGRGSGAENAAASKIVKPDTGGTKPARTTVWVGHPDQAMSQMQAMTEKLQAMQTRNQVSQKISDVGQDIALTRQELEKASRDQSLAQQGVQADARLTTWEKLSVTAKARTINRLKDKLQEMELERSRLHADLSQQVNSGSYRVSGEEILKGMTEEA